MAVTFTVEDGTGKAGANSYASEANGDDYHLKHLYAGDWTAASSGDKQKALMMATRLLDDHFRWEGRKVGDTQALAWPRFNIFDADGFLVQSNTLPPALLDATAETARGLISADRTAETDDRGFSRIKAGSVEVVIDPGDRKPVITAVVRRMLAPFGVAVGGASVPLIRT